MIVGGGLIAKHFKQTSYREDTQHIIFASGVSSSTEITKETCDRELNLVLDVITNNPGKKLIYFSSAFVDIVDSAYYTHKFNVETLIRQNSDCLIMRIPQLVGFGGNKTNLFNYLKHCIITSREITTGNDTRRSFLDIDDLIRYVEFCENHTGVMLLSFVELTRVVDMCNYIGELVRTQPLMKLSNSISVVEYPKNSILIDKATTELKICVDGYNFRTIKKYIGDVL